MSPLTRVIAVCAALIVGVGVSAAQTTTRSDDGQQADPATPEGSDGPVFGPPETPVAAPELPTRVQQPARGPGLASTRQPHDTIILGAAFTTNTTFLPEMGAARGEARTLFSEMVVELSTRKTVNSFFGLYSDNRIGYVFVNNDFTPLAQNAGLITPFLRNSGSAIVVETRFGVDYAVDFSNLQLPSLEFRFMFGPNLTVLVGHENLAFNAQIPTMAGNLIGVADIEGGQTTTWLYGLHLGIGFDFATADQSFGLGTTLFLDAGERSSAFSHNSPGFAANITTLSNDTSYVGGEFGFYADVRATENTSLRLSYELDIENTALPTIAEAHQIGLSLVVRR